MSSKKQKTTGKWVFVPADTNSYLSEEQLHEIKLDEVTQMLSISPALGGNRFAAAEEFENYFPGSNKVPDTGAWVLVKNPPPTEYTVPPLSVWFAEPWPMNNERHSSHRVKIMTPKGELGLFPREYSLIEDPGKYYEFVGDGMEVKFFGNEDGVPKEALFYLRSRGIAKKDAMILLIGEVKAHGVMWIESSKEVCAQLGREWPCDERLATK